ncbi:MAG: glycosyltransferase family 2 protein [Chloroflexales bacterium]|nr:glycosyltransferase family 2 protein [Chloroflexales bacterium]
MKFSVLLPTRNRLDYLRYAVETVLRQDYYNWELIVFDNCSEDDVAGYVRTLNDSRIQYYRTEQFVSVTENWNNAINKSSGDYVVMLGDDDGLMPGYFSTLKLLIERHAHPDLVYTGAYLYAYPGAMPGSPQGYLQPYGYASFLQGLEAPRLLARDEALALVQHALNFRVRYGFNMQFVAIARPLIAQLAARGPFFQSPFPDYYAMNVLFLKAARILAVPQPLVVIGVTTKSYGYFHFNKRERAGMAFLNNAPDPASAKRLEAVVLPGTNINTSWLFAMETLRANYGREFPLRVGYRRYRMLQIVNMYKNAYVDGRISADALRDLNQLMRPGERLLFATILPLFCTLLLLASRAGMRGVIDYLRPLLRQFPAYAPPPNEGNYRTLLDVFEHAEPQAATRQLP